LQNEALAVLFLAYNKLAIVCTE